ncbi:DEAD/DEAH box helicase family protein [Oscillatoria laete-virens NRMC-F 0139]|nr:DEAD/DEAH box helicase family protein [Oscillatoria laete-virens]MDL5053337.1 DEAD/DEAH box helicase family protein [Oscillatoria laete-virens NRMC-F 0139]
MELRPYQQAAVDALYAHLRKHDDNPCVVLPTGCHAERHPILMFDGTIKRVEQIVVGDILMGPDSQPRRVLALCRGQSEMYRIVPYRSESFIVNGDHILSLVCTNEGKKGACYRQGGEIENISLHDYFQKSRSWKHLRKLYRVPIDFQNCANLPIPPYILGLLLGDGCLRNTVDLTTEDDEVAASWFEYARSIGCDISVSDSGGRCPTYSLVKSCGRQNIVREALIALELAECDSESKFIPHNYLVASREERQRLLAGLMDTDGARSKTGFEYTTKSEQLASDVVYLCRSLGFSARCKQKYSYCQNGNGDWYYRIHIYGDMTPIPCRIPRKRPAVRLMNKSVLREGFTVEPCGTADFFGFTLDADHLYVDGNFIVHHNSGKTPVIATICRDAVQLWRGRVLIVAHVKELLEQAADKIQALAPNLLFGIYSAGLGSRDTLAPVIIAGIQSVYRRVNELGHFDLVIIDEAHMIPFDGDGMYRTLISGLKQFNPNLRVIGLTATPFRMNAGSICAPENVLQSICYEISVRELIAQKYLCPLISKAGKQKANFESLHVRAGEFVGGEVEKLMDDTVLVEAACREITEYTRERHSVLIFSSGVKHGEHIRETLERLGVGCRSVFGDTLDFDRAQTLADFKAGKIKYLVNVNVLTTGFDAPNVDCVVMLRPTLSPGLYYQMVGRGFRLHPAKQNCLVLDYGGNVLRHGPVDAIQAVTPINGDGDAPAKECPQCFSVIAAGYAKCPDCGFEFPPREKQKHERVASEDGILTGQVSIQSFPVEEVAYSVHCKRNAPPDAPRTMRVEYRLSLNRYQSEWICLEHDGFAGQKAIAWWKKRSILPAPQSVSEACELAYEGALKEPIAIKIKKVAGEDFDRIVGYEWTKDDESRRTQREPEYAPAEDEIPF